MTPIVEGRVLHLEYRGLYDGVSLLWDRETGSLWHHITGASLHGPLKAHVLAPVRNVLHTTVDEALAADPRTRVAISDRPIRQDSRWAPFAERVPVLGEMFLRTMSHEDRRRPNLDIGLGVWTETAATYYPLETIQEAGNALVDEFQGQRLVVYFSPRARAPGAFYTTARTARWEGDVLRLDNGDVYRSGALYAADGTRRAIQRPLQVFTRWYGYALTFPETAIYGQ